MEYNFTNSGGFSYIQPSENGTYTQAKGGTENMYHGLMKRLPDQYKDRFQIICSRVRQLDEHKQRVLWLHDIWLDEENNHLKIEEDRRRFDKLVFVSNQQFNSYNQAFGIRHNESVVLRNAIDPIEYIGNEKPSDRINLIYHTTPHRGLEILVPVFEFLCQRFDNIYLDVYSSFEIYGWKNRDIPYQKVFDACRKHPRINYHGYQPNHVVREALKKAHIFAFPSIWPETSCIAAIEAMAAGCIVVAPDFAALPETLGNFGFMYRFNENPQDHANMFATVLISAIQNIRRDNIVAGTLAQSKTVNSLYSWERRLPQWIEVLDGIAK